MSSSSEPSSKVSVLFVCLGNICRSTMAEGVFRSIARGNPRIGEIDSCGTGAYHTLEPPDSRTMATLRKHGITDYDHGARKVALDDFRTFDYIFAMDNSNLHNLQKLERKAGTSSKARVMLFGEFGNGKGAEEVEDPYYGADNGFDTVFEQVTQFSKNFLAQVVDKSTSG